MTAIAPNTTIRFGTLQLMKDSEDTFYFSSLAAQESFMLAHLTHVYTKYTYQREHRNYLKIEITSEIDADKWDYMMFQNTNYGTKWFYAFVTETEWINNLTVKIYYEIDYIQTYWAEYNMSPCYVERQHDITDNIGDNLVPDIYFDDEVVYNKDGIKNLVPRTSDVYNVIMYSSNTDYSEVSVFKKVPTGFKLQVFQNGDTQGMSDFIQQLGDINRVLAIYTIPTILFSSPSDYPAWGTGSDLMSHPLTGIVNSSAPSPTTSTTLDGYTPVNHKLYTFPYCYLRVMNDKGEYVNYKYELFHNRAPAFVSDLTPLIPVTINMAPKNYAGIDNVNEPNTNTYAMTDKTKIISLSDYPQGSWRADTYTQWANFQGLPNLVTGLAKSAVMGTLNPVAGVTSAAGTVMSTMVNGFVNRAKADDVKGNTSTANSSLFSQRKNLIAYRMSIRAYTARMIDDYFTMFGYAQNKILTPNKHARSRFTYVKTIDSNVYGNLPNNAKNEIAKLYNRGIRFWADTQNFRNYAYPNNVL